MLDEQHRLVVGIGDGTISRCSAFTADDRSGRTAFGEPDYRALKKQFAERGRGNWVLMPPYPYGPNESLLDLPGIAANRPRAHPFGTDDRGRDVLVRLAYGFNISLTFALLVMLIADGTASSSARLLGYFERQARSPRAAAHRNLVVAAVPLHHHHRQFDRRPRSTFRGRCRCCSRRSGCWSHSGGLRMDGDHLLHPRRVLSREGEGLRRRRDRDRRVGARHHVPAHPAERADAGRLVRAVRDRREYQRARRARLPGLRPAGAHAQLGRADRSGHGEPHEMVARVLPARRAVHHAAAGRLHRRSRARGLRSEGVLAGFR